MGLAQFKIALDEVVGNPPDPLILKRKTDGGYGATARAPAAEAECPLSILSRWCIAAAAAQPWMLVCSPFCDDEWIEVGSTSSIEEGAMRWRISWVLMCR